MRGPGLRLLSSAVCLLIVLSGCCAAFAQSKCTVTIPIVVAPDEDFGGAAKTPRKFEIQVAGTALAPIPPQTSPKRVALLLDVSASMRSRLPGPLVADTLQALQPSDEVTFVAFGTRELLSIGPTTDRNALLASIHSADVPKDYKLNLTAMRDAVAKVLQRKEKYDSIVLFTDGGDTASKTKDGALRKLLEGSSVRIFAFLFIDTAFATPEEALGSRVVKEMVNLSGGFVFLPGQWNLHRKSDPPRLDQASQKRVAASVELLARAIDNPPMFRI